MPRWERSTASGSLAGVGDGGIPLGGCGRFVLACVMLRWITLVVINLLKVFIKVIKFADG